MRFCAVLLAAVLLPASLSHAQTAPQRVKLGVAAMQRWYLPRTGLYEGTGWWNSANAITVLVDSMRTTSTRRYLPVVEHTFQQAQIVVPKSEQVGPLKDMTGAPGFLNKFYDDEGWWALAWIDAFDLTGDSHYLRMSQSIFKDMAGGWDGTCGGGIWWSKDRKYKNAIANELFLSVAAHLATRESNASERERYTKWADREWAWFRASGMVNGDHLVNDGLSIDTATGTCSNNHGIVWTYNQGVLIGALNERAKTSPDATLVPEARSIADAALLHLVDKDGILHDPCESKCDDDGVQFKGIFVRDLAALQARVHSPQYAKFMQANADSIWRRAQGPGHRFGVRWSGPFAEPGAGTQASALDALVAAAAVQ